MYRNSSHIYGGRRVIGLAVRTRWRIGPVLTCRAGHDVRADADVASHHRSLNARCILGRDGAAHWARPASIASSKKTPRARDRKCRRRIPSAQKSQTPCHTGGLTITAGGPPPAPPPGGGSGGGPPFPPAPR